jgi:dihydrofolate reductase
VLGVDVGGSPHEHINTLTYQHNKAVYTKMRKVILQVAVTLDGLIEGPGGEYDWCFTDQDYGMKDFMKRMGGKGFGKMKQYVFSNTLKKSSGETEIVKGDIGEQVRKIKMRKGKDIWLFGGASLTTSLMNEGLVDELALAVHPILLGSGKPLFQGIKGRVKTKLIDVKTYSSGLAMLNYSVL